MPHSRVPALHKMGILIEDGTLLDKLYASRLDHQVAFHRQAHLTSATESPLDHMRIRARLQHQIIFQLTMLAVINDVDARIHRAISHTRILPYAGAPVCSRTDKIIRLSGQRIECFDRRRAIGAYQRDVDPPRTGREDRPTFSKK